MVRVRLYESCDTRTININPFRTAVSLWGQTTQISSSLSPKRDCGSKGVNKVLTLLIPVLYQVRINTKYPWYIATTAVLTHTFVPGFVQEFLSPLVQKIQ